MTDVRPSHRNPHDRLNQAQDARNAALLRATPTMGAEVRSEVLPLTLDLGAGKFDGTADTALAALSIRTPALASAPRRVNLSVFIDLFSPLDVMATVVLPSI